MFILILLRISLSQAQTTDYSLPSSWYGGSPIVEKDVDVLFFPPTATSTKDGMGLNMNVSDPTQRKALDYWYAIAKELFGESCNFYGAYYRQAVMESWGMAEFPQVYKIAMQDAQAAFDYYMKYLNNGRPFILAGHSQGARIVYSLIKSRINADNYPMMIAAYPIGYRVTAADMKESKYIVPAKRATDYGVCVSYHTATSSRAAMYPGNIMNINPMNWRTDTLKAPAPMHLGSVFFDSDGKITKEFRGTITARIDPLTGCVLVQGVDPNEFNKPYVGGHRFKIGNLHLQDMNIFFRNLQQNVRERIASYKANKTKI